MSDVAEEGSDLPTSYVASLASRSPNGYSRHKHDERKEIIPPVLLRVRLRLSDLATSDLTLHLLCHACLSPLVSRLSLSLPSFPAKVELGLKDPKSKTLLRSKQVGIYLDASEIIMLPKYREIYLCMDRMGIDLRSCRVSSSAHARQRKSCKATFDYPIS